MHDVFISYSSIDKATADAACATFEKNGIRCWIAPRDVPAGSEWAEAIIDAIESARIMVLIFSTHSNESRQVRREIELAVSRGLTIMPIRLEKIAPTKSMAYYMAGVHWLDALSPPLEAKFVEMVGWMKPVLAVGAAPEAKPRPGPNKAAPKPPPESKPRAGTLTVDEAQRLYEAARAMISAGRGAEGVAEMQKLVTQIGDPTDAPMQRKLSMILHLMALNLESLGQTGEAIAAFDEVLRRYRKAPDSVLAPRIAMVLVDRGNPLNKLGRRREALSSYDELIDMFGTSTDAGIIQQVARAGVCRGIILDEDGKAREGIAAYDAVVRRHGSSSDPRVLEIVATALYNRAVGLESLGRRREAMAGCEDIVRRFASNGDEKLQRQVALARTYLSKLRA